MQPRLECCIERTGFLSGHLVMLIAPSQQKVGQTFSKVNHFLNTHQSQQLNSHLHFFLTFTFPRKLALLLSSARNHAAFADDSDFSLTLQDKRQVIVRT